MCPRKERKMKILCIDDSGEMTLLCRSIFESENYEVTSIKSGLDGIQLIHDFKFDLVLLDIEKSKFNGKDVVGVLQKENFIGKQPIILFMESSVTDSEIEQIMAQGLYQCLRKPIKIEILSSVFKGLTKNKANQKRILKKWPLKNKRQI